MKKQFNFYIDSRCKSYIDDIRNFDSVKYSGLSDSQIVEKLIFEKVSELDIFKKVSIEGLCDDPYCPDCHYSLDCNIDAKFCPRCGRSLDWSVYHRINP